MKLRLLFLPALLAVTLGAFNADDKMLRKASEAITGAAYRAHVAGLASDDLQGREPGSEGELRTIEYIEKEYLELGLQPAAGGDFRQEVALVEITGSAQSLSFSRGAGGMTLAYGDEMVIGSRRVWVVTWRKNWAATVAFCNSWFTRCRSPWARRRRTW